MPKQKTYWQVEYVRTLSELPEELVKGRAYFVGAEQYIVIDHGDGLGVQVYGNKPGLQGLPGEPIPEMTSDINQLGKAIIKTQYTLMKLHKTYTERFKEYENIIAALIAVTTEKLNIDLDEIKQAAQEEEEEENGSN